MDGATYQGIALDGDTALALLEWQIEMGADVPVMDEPIDRFDLPARVAAPDHNHIIRTQHRLRGL